MKVIKFGAVWCPGCLIMKPRWAKIEEAQKIDSIFYDYDENEDLVKKYNIGETLPVAILMDDSNNEIHRFIGERSEKEILKVIEENRL